MIIRRVRSSGRAPRSGERYIGVHEYQSVIGSESAQFRVGEMTFADGTRTKLHVHDSEQIILVTDGEGIIGSADEEHVIGVGDVAFIQAGEPHWHGSLPAGRVTQWTFLGPHSTRPA